MGDALRRPSAAANPQVLPATYHGGGQSAFSDQDCRTTMDGIVPLRCDPWLEPIYRLRLDARRTSHPVAVPRTAGTTIPHSGGHRAREGGSTLYVGISQPLFVTVRLPGSNGADQALVELTIK